MDYIDQLRKNREVVIEGVYTRLEKMANKAISISNSKPNRPESECKKCQHIFRIALEMRLLSLQAQEIRRKPYPKNISKPIPSFIEGGIYPSGMAIVGDKGRELIINKDGKAVIERLEIGKEVIPHKSIFENSPLLQVIKITMEMHELDKAFERMRHSNRMHFLQKSDSEIQAYKNRLMQTHGYFFK